MCGRSCGIISPSLPSDVASSAFKSERFISEADSVLAYEGFKGHQQKRCELRLS